jgi:tetrahydromethanopterin S-methyltransferase subunit G
VTEGIIIAILSLAGTFLGTFSGIKLISYRLEQLERKVEKHNNLVERQYNIEKITAVLSEDLKVVNHRLEELERNNG